ncbi:G-box-binding factor 2-like [Gigantopelta aegis]|uniref:G-box-binding factor 2-like n=1 Tax=Gigantopelta aegis TaxID=1735272 RepID=UPI001B88E0F9|nr:G-box-binding factor 2-like [Gigantopelta aegis]XP_041352828.1 G-box-binding factor 2-like [Gigantopelta aegis]
MEENGRIKEEIHQETPQEKTSSALTNGHTVICNGVAGHDEKLDGKIHSPEAQDIPLDFSFKRKSIESLSESFTDDSRPSSNSPHQSHDSSNEHFSNNNKINESSLLDKDDSIMEPKTPVSRIPNSALAAMGVFPDMNSGMVSNGNMLTGFPAMAAFIEHQRRAQASKNTRPFKAYPKSTLTMPMGYYGMPGYVPVSQSESMMHGLNVNSEEIMNMYKHQIQALKEHEKRLSGGAKQQSVASVNSNVSSPVRNSSNGSSSSGSYSETQLNNSTSYHNPNSPSSRITSLPYTSGTTTLVSSTSTLLNSSGSRKRPKILPDEQKDEAYWERRRKNNEAAKRSRDARRAKEDEIAIRAALLEQENLKLRVEVAALKSETARLRCMLYNS